MKSLGELQLQVMQAVWGLEQATVSDVHQALSARRKIAYTTVMTTMRSLERRGLLRHEAAGKAFLYKPAVSRQDYAARSVGHLVEAFFGGQEERLLCHLLGAESVSKADVGKIKKMLSEGQGEDKP